MRAQRIYKALLLCYPAAFRHEYGGQMLLVFAEQLGEARRSGGRPREAALWLRTAWDALAVAPREHVHVIEQDLRFALRSIAGNPSFAAVAILSLMLGIGANTAIFSLWDGLCRGQLPLVKQPGQLLSLTNPEISGSWNGSWSGERAWMSFTEYQLVRQHDTAFSGVLAAQSYLDDWDVRSAGGSWEVAHGRMVSDNFFDVLGVHPALGRGFANEAAAEAVISHDYWLDRFGGNSNVIGQPVVLRGGTLTVVGVAPRGFTGESVAQQPDLWVPVGVQPLVRPGQDWLHTAYPNNTMWLNVIGRLRPGMTATQGEAQANASFRSVIDSFYGSAPPVLRNQAATQFLRARPAARGVSPARGAFSNSLIVLLCGVAVLLLIACANLANLLLARGAARRPEMILRVSLGASRGRLLRQLMTESLLLAMAGGVASLAAAYLLRAAVTWMITQADRNFRLDFQWNTTVLGFTLIVTVLAAVLFGLLPAWQATRPGHGEILKEQSRHATPPARRLRWSKLLVSVQLALSLPLVVGAGLLARTLYNIQHVELGYRADGLVMARLDTSTAGYDDARRSFVLADLRQKLARRPEVEDATFATIGLFGGGDLALPVHVEGRALVDPKGAGSSIDLVGPDYFSTIGTPLLRGRPVLAGDDVRSAKVCVINEAFARLLFAGTDPLGARVTVIAPKGRDTYEVAGVAADARWVSLRGPVRPRMFVPLTQAPLSLNDASLLVRIRQAHGTQTHGSEAAAATIRRAIANAAPGLPIRSIHTMTEQLAPLIAQDQSVAMLAEVFGCAALALAAIGLYGVLSFGVTQRRSEVAIRMALGAHAARVTAMVLRETAWLVAAGLVLGAGLAYWASRLIRIRLFGVAPEDPATLTAAIGILIAVAAAAAYLPARRAGRLDPIAALREE